MPWKTPSRGKPYYVRSGRKNGKRYREYIGSGPRAERIAAEDERHRQQIAADKENFRAWRERVEKIDAEFVAYDEAVTALLNVAMTAAGYHRPNRGKWRKRRMEDTQITKAEEELIIFHELMGKADQEPAMYRRTVEMLQERGELQTALERLCSPIEMLVPSLAREASVTDSLVQNLAKARVRERRSALAGPNPSALEELLAERVALCEFQVDYCELALQFRLSALQLDPEGAMILQKRVDSAHKRCLSAAKALAQVRQYQEPSVQVNIGERQINVLESPQPPGSAAPNGHPFGLAAPSGLEARAPSLADSAPDPRIP